MFVFMVLDLFILASDMHLKVRMVQATGVWAEISQGSAVSRTGLWGKVLGVT